MAARWMPLSSERIMYSRHPAVVPHLDPGLRVEAVTPASALECARLETANFGLLPDAIGEAPSCSPSRSAMARRAPSCCVSCASRSPRRASCPDPGSAGLHAVGVAARHRRRGYGRLITAVATRAGLATGHKLVWLSVDEDNRVAVDLYRSLGFEPSFSWTRWAAPA